MPFHYGILLLENVVVVSTTKVLRNAQICFFIHFLQFPQEANVDQDVLFSGSNLVYLHSSCLGHNSLMLVVHFDSSFKV
jgi:hypothetical protein